MRYRRAFIPGGSFFFTAVTEQRRPLFASANAVGVLRTAFRAVRSTRPFEVDAIVVLPDHLHCIWTLPVGDADFATRWRLIKTYFTKHCDPALRTEPHRARTAKREQALWQHRYWEHALRDEADVIRHVEYAFQPGQTRACVIRDGVAVFQLSPVCCGWGISSGVGSGYDRFRGGGV